MISVILSNYQSCGKQNVFCMRWLTRSCVQPVIQRSKSIGLKQTSQTSLKVLYVAESGPFELVLPTKAFELCIGVKCINIFKGN